MTEENTNTHTHKYTHTEREREKEREKERKREREKDVRGSFENYVADVTVAHAACNGTRFIQERNSAHTLWKR